MDDLPRRFRRRYSEILSHRDMLDKLEDFDEKLESMRLARLDFDEELKTFKH